MRRKRHRHLNVHGESRQFDLFAPPVVDNAVQGPEWRTLPDETRQTLTSLMVRLLLEHANRDRRPRQEETRHDV